MTTERPKAAAASALHRFHPALKGSGSAGSALASPYTALLTLREEGVEMGASARRVRRAKDAGERGGDSGLGDRETTGDAKPERGVEEEEEEQVVFDERNHFVAMSSLTTAVVLGPALSGGCGGGSSSVKSSPRGAGKVGLTRSKAVEIPSLGRKKTGHRKADPVALYHELERKRREDKSKCKKSSISSK